MRTFLFLVIQILFVTYISGIPHETEKTLNNEIVVVPLEKSKDLININLARAETWNKIKESIKKYWEYVKNMASNTKEKLRKWIENVKNQANNSLKELKKKLQNLKEKATKVIAEMNEIAKNCTKGQKKVEEIISNVVKVTTECINEQTNSLTNLREKATNLSIYDTEFMKNAEKKINSCETDKCLAKVTKKLFKELENMEDYVINTRLQSRSAIDNVLEAIVACSVNGLIKAAEEISIEVLEVIECISKETENSHNTLITHC